jgi:hypothetical protein
MMSLRHHRLTQLALAQAQLARLALVSGTQ